MSGTRPGRRPGVGFGLVGLVSLGFGVVGVFPFILAGYVVMQLVLAPVGLAEVDPTDNDGVGVQLLSGVLLPLAVVVGWAFAVHRLRRGWRLGAVPGWSLAIVALAAPTAVFLLA